MHRTWSRQIAGVAGALLLLSLAVAPATAANPNRSTRLFVQLTEREGGCTQGSLYEWAGFGGRDRHHGVRLTVSTPLASFEPLTGAIPDTGLSGKSGSGGGAYDVSAAFAGATPATITVSAILLNRGEPVPGSLVQWSSDGGPCAGEFRL